jgi:hypothetical protein
VERITRHDGLESIAICPRDLPPDRVNSNPDCGAETTLRNRAVFFIPEKISILCFAVRILRVYKERRKGVFK